MGILEFTYGVPMEKIITVVQEGKKKKKEITFKEVEVPLDLRCKVAQEFLGWYFPENFLESMNLKRAQSGKDFIR